MNTILITDKKPLISFKLSVNKCTLKHLITKHQSQCNLINKLVNRLYLHHKVFIQLRCSIIEMFTKWFRDDLLKYCCSLTSLY